MATPLAPGYAYSGQTKHRLSYGQVKKLAEAFGLPGDAIAQIAKGESSLNADIQQRDPGDGMVGYGLLQMTPNAWGKGSAAYKHMQSLGGIEAMKDPVKNMAMARFLYKAAGNKLSPWYGTRFLTNRSGEGKLGPIDESRVDGSLAKAVTGGGTASAARTRTTTTTTPGVDNSLARLSLVQSFLDDSNADPVSFAVQARDLKDIAPTTTSKTVRLPGAGGSGDTARAAAAPSGATGAVHFATGADRPGVATQQIVKSFLSRVAGHATTPINVGTGTNHNQMTTSGNVSDHWTGHAADLPQPVDSHQGDMVAAHALQAAGIPWSQAVRMAQRGGVFNVTPSSGPYKGHRVQVLWKTMVGGNHHNHVHIGIR